MTLQKALLSPALGEESSVKKIEFMFNPTQLSFEGQVDTADNAGARSEQSGKTKVSFSNIKAYKIIINNVVFDTYENEGSERNVLEKYINHFRAAVKFIDGKERPPIYTFSWGKDYFKYCFVERLNYKLTMFLPDGTPVRAVIDNLTLKETDGIPSETSTLPKAEPSPSDTREARGRK